VNFMNFHETRTEKTHSTHVTFIRPRVPAAGASNVMWKTVVMFLCEHVRGYFAAIFECDCVCSVGMPCLTLCVLEFFKQLICLCILAYCLFEQYYVL
jgi:hypothetical protein